MLLRRRAKRHGDVGGCGTRLDFHTPSMGVAGRVIGSTVDLSAHIPRRHHSIAVRSKGIAKSVVQLVCLTSACLLIIVWIAGMLTVNQSRIIRTRVSELQRGSKFG